MKPIHGACQDSGFIAEQIEERQHGGRVAGSGASTQIGLVRRGLEREAWLTRRRSVSVHGCLPHLVASEGKGALGRDAFQASRSDLRQAIRLGESIKGRGNS